MKPKVERSASFYSKSAHHAARGQSFILGTDVSSKFIAVQLSLLSLKQP
jgi:hypothetical protein